LLPSKPKRHKNVFHIYLIAVHVYTDGSFVNRNTYLDVALKKFQSRNHNENPFSRNTTKVQIIGGIIDTNHHNYDQWRMTTIKK
jgi:hypothetical protein